MSHVFSTRPTSTQVVLAVTFMVRWLSDKLQPDLVKRNSLSNDKTPQLKH
jgi:hypothetical protein